VLEAHQVGNGQILALRFQALAEYFQGAGASQVISCSAQTLPFCAKTVLMIF
jgi:hypothetical protein